MGSKNDISPKWNAEKYRQQFSFVHEYGHDLLELLNPQPDERILDLGCGTGQLTDKLFQSGANVIGMDKSSEMIKAAREQYPKLDFIVYDAADFRFDILFDAIFSNAALHWVQQYRECANCMYHNLRSGGRLVAEFGAEGNIQTIETALRQVLVQRGHKSQSQREVWYFPSPSSYTEVLESVGFRVQNIWHFDRPTLLADGITSWLEMFSKPFVNDLDIEEKNRVFKEVETRIRKRAFKHGHWYADYKRLRVIAYKPD